MIKQLIEEIVELLDSSTLLGAAYDCMSEVSKDKFKEKLKFILEKERFQID